MSENQITTSGISFLARSLNLLTGMTCLASTHGTLDWGFFGDVGASVGTKDLLFLLPFSNESSYFAPRLGERAWESIFKAFVFTRYLELRLVSHG